jgi:hypothetical protein
MPDVARLSDTAEHDIALMSGGWLPTDLPAVGTVRFPHQITARIARAEKGKVERLATVSRARAFDFNPDLRSAGVLSWLDTTLDRLRELASADPDWDGYGAPPVHPGALIGALTFLNLVSTHLGRRPEIVATGSGNVQFEWREAGYSIDVEVGPQSDYCATLFVRGAERNEWNGNVLTGVDPDLAHVIAFGWQGVDKLS